MYCIREAYLTLSVCHFDILRVTLLYCSSLFKTAWVSNSYRFYHFEPRFNIDWNVAALVQYTIYSLVCADCWNHFLFFNTRWGTVYWCYLERSYRVRVQHGAVIETLIFYIVLVVSLISASWWYYSQLQLGKTLLEYSTPKHGLCQGLYNDTGKTCYFQHLLDFSDSPTKMIQNTLT